jgi:hypothetical protein
MKNRLSYLLILILVCFSSYSQDIPESINYAKIYDFIDELATDGYFELNSAVKPYSRVFISSKLLEANAQVEKLNSRQRSELRFYLNEFALEQDRLPATNLNLINSTSTRLSCLQPALHYRDTIIRAKIAPILGMVISHNSNGNLTKRWYGLDFQAMMGKNLSVFGSLRDISMAGPVVNNTFMARLSGTSYLNDLPGYEYKEATYGGDFSDSRGGIKYGWNWGSLGLVKENVVWGDNYHGSNILSGRAPSFPMLTLHLAPCKWFEMNYIHGWLVSNVVDSSQHYTNNIGTISYRMKNKFIAANFFTITPFKNFKFSVGNSIIYAEQNVQAAYLIPIAFYKSMDHTMTKGLALENQNSQVFFNLSSRNIKHLHLYATVYADEIKFSRFSPSSPDKNPISYKFGGCLTNFPVENLSFIGEFTHNNIICYKHTVPALTWASNDYNLGSYLGDNSEEIYLALKYKPFRGFDMTLSYLNAGHGGEYEYINRDKSGVEAITAILSQPQVGAGAKPTWTNQTLSLCAQYEVFNNAYATLNVSMSDIKGYDNTNANPVVGELVKTAQGYMDVFTPKYLQGKQTTITAGFSIGF